MKEITVKNIPERIYKELEKKAIRNNHTIDEEILIQLNRRWIQLLGSVHDSV